MYSLLFSLSNFSSTHKSCFFFSIELKIDFFSDYFIKNQNLKETFVGKCWCEEASYLDFYDTNVREFWKKTIINNKSFFFEAKNIYIWNDMNEPSVFKQKDLTLPKLTKFNYFT